MDSMGPVRRELFAQFLESWCIAANGNVGNRDDSEASLKHQTAKSSGDLRIGHERRRKSYLLRSGEIQADFQFYVT